LSLVDQYGRPLVSRPPRGVRIARNRRAAIDALYDSAQTTNENAKHWRWTDNYSAAQANSRDVRQTIRERARYEVANNSFATGIVDTLANDSVGIGPRLQMRTADEKFNRRVEALWAEWSRKTKFAAKLRTARRARTVDGESFLISSNNRRLRSRHTLDIQIVECDQFEDPSDTATETHIAGVHLDSDRQPIAYDMLQSHPGDHTGFDFKAEPIDVENVIHWFRCDRPGQIRGVSELTPALPLFAMLRRYTLAVLLAAETAADFAAILETVTAPYDEDGNPEIDDIDPFDSVDIDRGMMTSLPRGWKMNQFKPEQPVTTYKEFRDAILNEIARCVNMPANKARCDSSGYNYASGRLDHGTYYEALDVDRNQCEIDVIDRVFEWWFDEASLIPDYLPAFPAVEDGMPHTWYWTGHKHADPSKEANAAKVLHGLGLLTDEAYLLREGIDPEQHHRQLVTQYKRRAELARLQLAAGVPMPAEGREHSGKSTEGRKPSGAAA